MKKIILSVLVVTTLMANVNEVITVKKVKQITVEENVPSVSRQCNNVYKPIMEDIYEYKTVNNESTVGGLLTGAGIGSIVHNNIGGGSGKKWATGISSIIGYGIGSQAFGDTETYRRKIGEKVVDYQMINECKDITTNQKVIKQKYLLTGKSEIEEQEVSKISDTNDKTFIYNSMTID